MKKVIISAAIMLVTSVSVFSQSYESAFQLSFLPPLSTNGIKAVRYTNGGSFNILAGVSKNEKHFTLGGIANIVINDANGFQMAGLSNYAGNNGSGFMLSGLANIVRSDYRGFQLSGLVNTANQLSGFQLSGLSNIAGNVTGFQLSGLGNVAGNVRGLQLGGLFNVAKKVSGAQFAALVNIAESSDCPIALLNIIKNGEYSIAVTYNEIGSTVVTFRSGGRITYGILGMGYNHKTRDKGFVTEGGLGAHINITHWFRINNEIKGGTIGNFSKTSTFYTNYSLLPAFRIVRHFELFGGPSINYMQTDNTGNKSMFPGKSLWKKYTDSKLQQVYIGWQVGIQFIL